MNVITLASRKGGAGKSTLTAHLAGYAHSLGHRCLVIDADPQGSLTLWHSLRRTASRSCRPRPAASTAPWPTRMVEGYDWVFIDTAPTMWVVVQEAIRAATMVLMPARPAFFDLDAVLETVKTARERDKPYAVVLNAAPSKRDDKESPVMAQSRAFLDQHGIPVWWRPDQPARRLFVDACRRRERLRAGAGRRWRRGRDRRAVVGGRAFGRGDQRRLCGRTRGSRRDGIARRPRGLTSPRRARCAAVWSAIATIDADQC